MKGTGTVPGINCWSSKINLEVGQLLCRGVVAFFRMCVYSRVWLFQTECVVFGNYPISCLTLLDIFKTGTLSCNELACTASQLAYAPRYCTSWIDILFHHKRFTQLYIFVEDPFLLQDYLLSCRVDSTRF